MLVLTVPIHIHVTEEMYQQLIDDEDAVSQLVNDTLAAALPDVVELALDASNWESSDEVLN